METVINRFVLLNPPSVLEGIILFLFLILVLYGSFRSTKHLASSKKRTTIISLHLLSFLLIIFILFNPGFRVEHYKEEKRNLAILVDNTWSMNLPGDIDGNIRVQTVKNYLEKNEDVLSQIEKNFYVEYFLFDQELKPSSLNSILKNKPESTTTEIGKVLEELRDKRKKGELDVAIIISDGADNAESTNLDDQLEGLDFAINTVSPVTEDSLNDVWIDDIISSEITFLRYPYSIEVVIKTGRAENFKIPVSLYEEDKLMSIKEASIKSNEARVEFEINPLSLGRKIYTVSIPILSEELIEENNQKSFFTDVIINKIRVLHVAGSPSWDVKFLRKALKRNPNIDLVSFYILRDPSDLVFASERELSLIPFPVNEIFSKELDTFDVVIFQDFHFQPYGIFGFHLKNLKDYVSKHGGAFLMIGGSNSFNSGDYGRTIISDILPVELDYLPKTLSETISNQEFHPQLTAIGKNHPITRIVPNKNENEKHWNKMPELEGFNIVQGLNNSAMPLLSTADGQPILAIGKVDSGKVAAFMSDSSWRWNFVLGSEGKVSPHYEKFWNKLFLWFLNDPELKDIKVKTDKPIYNPGENAKIEISTLQEDLINRKSILSLTYPKGEENEIELEKISPNRVSAKVQVEENGIHKISITPDGESGLYNDLNSGETIFIVEPPEKELRGPTANDNILKSMAEKTGGKHITTDQGLEVLKIDTSKKKTITGYKTMKLWDNPLTFLVLLGLLSSEWLLRRRWGLK
jgi:uncharacterized membrane protein